MPQVLFQYWVINFTDISQINLNLVKHLTKTSNNQIFNAGEASNNQIFNAGEASNNQIFNAGETSNKISSSQFP